MNVSGPEGTTGQAQIAERHYAPYEGPRTGRFAAMVTISLTSARHVLGLGRPARHKVLPVIVLMIAFIPAVAISGFSLLSGQIDTGDVPIAYGEYLALISSAILLFTALVAPEVLTSDRTNGLLPLYLSTPLTRNNYLTAKALSLIGILSLITVVPPLLLLAGYTATGEGPSSVGDWFLTPARILLSGIAVAVLYSAVALAITSLATRRAFASIAIVLMFLTVSFAVGFATEAADVDLALNLVNVIAVGIDLPFHIFAHEVGFGQANSSYSIPDLGTLPLVAVYAAWVLMGFLVAWVRSRRIGKER